MKRLFILSFIAFIMCMSVSAKTANTEKQIVKEVCKDITKAYNLKACHIQCSKDADISYVLINGMSLWSHSYEYALSDISVVIDRYANILRMTQWNLDPDMTCATCEYCCMVDDEHNYTMMLVYYIDTNILAICVYKED